MKSTQSDSGVKLWSDIELGRFLLGIQDRGHEKMGDIITRVIEPTNSQERVYAAYCVCLAKKERKERKKAACAGFTLIELMVCIGIIALLIGLLAPGLSGAMDSARSARCKANLRSLGQAMTMYLDAGDGMLPFAAWSADARLSRLGPFDALATHLDAPMPVWDAQASETGRIEPFACPADKLLATMTGFSYAYAPQPAFQVLGRDHRREVTNLFMHHNPRWPIMFDAGGFHDTVNTLTLDGTVRGVLGRERR